MAKPAGWRLFHTPSTLSLTEIRSLIESEFSVEDAILEQEVPLFAVRVDGSSKESFERLAQKMKAHRLLPFLRKERNVSVIRVFARPEPRRTRIRTNIILFIATFVTVFTAGYFNSLYWIEAFSGSVFLQAAYYTVGLLVIVGFHEFGHQVTCQKKRIEATPPYFIPGPPLPIGFGTFGAVIMQKEPPVNRDQLFDLGFSGPVVSFILSIVVALIALQFSQIVDINLAQRLEAAGIELMPLPFPLAWTLLAEVFTPVAPGYMSVLPPFGLAAWLGFVITFLNLLPAWQLDGGHIARALFGEKAHGVVSGVGMGIAFATGFWFFGLLILFFMRGSRGSRLIGPLDEVSPITRSRKVLGVAAYVMLALSAVILWQWWL